MLTQLSSSWAIHVWRVKYADTAETVNCIILTYMGVMNVVKLLCRSNTFSIL